MKRLLLTCLLVVLPLAAQNDKPAAPAPETRTRVQKLFILKYADPRNLSELLRIFDASIIPNTEMHAMAVTASSDAMRSIEEAINRLDTPAAAPKNIELNVYLIVGSDTENGAASAIPKNLEDVVAQLKSGFPFKNYRLMDTLSFRTRTGTRASVQSSGGAMQFGSVSKPVTTNFALVSTTIAPDGATVHLDRIGADIRVPVEVRPGDFSVQQLPLNTDVDIKEGQKVVVGRLGINRDQALFLVMTVKVL